MSRSARVLRETGETRVEVLLNLDGQGHWEVDTGLGFLDHMLAQLARHSLIDLTVRGRRDPSGWHHLVEDIGISLGRALHQALGERKGITRFGHALVPLDEALAQVALDLSGRGYASVELGIEGEVEGLEADLLRHMLESFAYEARMTLHARVLEGRNNHHKAEALFKALARALRQAVAPDPRLGGEVPSTKGTLTA
ncbi:MAG: imidazoleglycerol-phosphate dehydratase HisB [Dehalococcoidia bacterium]|nr:imidazoleglycerol-phosphate dehydratase HisB [Dehalococcoidia bacterium]MDW8119609.1 imidazoleglycerol-phosphate dehydratase HisB [Chloroflexota bacterium]